MIRKYLLAFALVFGAGGLEVRSTVATLKVMLCVPAMPFKVVMASRKVPAPVFALEVTVILAAYNPVKPKEKRNARKRRLTLLGKE